MNKILYIAAVIGIATYLFWENAKPFVFGAFYKGNAIFILLLCLYIYLTNKKSFIAFFLMACSVNNLLDELLFDPAKLYWNELALLVIFPAVWVLRNRNGKRDMVGQAG